MASSTDPDVLYLRNLQNVSTPELEKLRDEINQRSKDGYEVEDLSIVLTIANVLKERNHQGKGKQSPFMGRGQ